MSEPVPKDAQPVANLHATVLQALGIDWEKKLRGPLGRTVPRSAGKPIAGGIPAAAYGFSEEVAARLSGRIELEDVDVGGVGGTLAANALSLAAMRATLGDVLTEEAFGRMIPLAERWTKGVEDAIAEARLPWHVTRLGCRAEYLFGPDRPRNGTEAHAASDIALERYLHLYALNRGILLTPFHNMALMSPATTEADVDRHTEVFTEAALELVGLR